DEESEHTPGQQELTKLMSVWSEYTTGSQDSMGGAPQGSQHTIGFDRAGSRFSPGSQDTIDLTAGPSGIHGEPTDTLVTPSTITGPARAWLLPLLAIAAAALVLLFTNSSDPGHDADGQATSDSVEPNPPDWRYGGILLLTDPPGESDQDHFFAARRALLNADYPLAERLLTPLLQSHPQDPAVHSLSALVHYLRGREGMSADASRRAEEASRDMDTPLADLLALSDRSWREIDNGAALLPRWEKLRATHPDPTVDLFFLVSARFLLGNEALLTEIQRARAAHPDWAFLVNLHITALAEGGRDAEILEVANEALSIVPDATAILLDRGEALFRLGDLEAAEADMKRVLTLDANFIAARTMLAGIYTLQDREADRLEQLMFSLGDTTPPQEQLAFLQQHGIQLANQGRLGEAEKIWTFCMSTAEETGDPNRSAECASVALVAMRFLTPPSRWGPWMDSFRNALSRPGLDRDIHQFRTLELKWSEAILEIRSGRVEGGEAMLQQMQTMSNRDLPFDSRDFFSRQLRLEIALSQQDHEELDTLLEEFRTTAATGSTEWCFVPFVQARAARVQPARTQQLVSSLRSITEGQCVHDPMTRGMMTAQSRLWLAEHLDERPEEARAELDAFRSAWPSADPDLEVMELAATLEERLRAEE
ncbi:MAG: hypothetical protein QGG40_12045, partial [Myxococcota bacterium]|nr:hypothetical protein [Myxococcota bacterium]